MTACNTLVRENFSAVLFDEYMEKYENITVDHINAQLGNNKPLASEIPSLGTTDVMAGKTAWQKDPFKQDRDLDPMREALSPGAKDTLGWFYNLLQSYVLYFMKCLVTPALRASITKRISEARASGRTIIWHTFKKWIRSKLVDYSPHLLLESIQTMTRPSTMTCVHWTTTFVQLRKVLFDKYEQPIVGIIAWFYWASQVTVQEWAVLRDAFELPSTARRLPSSPHCS